MPGSTATKTCRVAAKRAMTRLGAWLGVAALLLQLLVPLSAPQAAWVEEGLFPPTCSAHPGVDAPLPAAAPSDCSQCPLCQASAGERLLPPLRGVNPAYDRMARPARYSGWLSAFPGPAVVRPPLPSRGPPLAA